MNKSVNILGLPVGAYTMPSLLARFEELIQAPGCATSYGLNAHSFNLSYVYPQFYEALSRADMLYADGASLQLAARLLRKKGARTIRAAVSHCILNEIAYERLGNGLIDELITTNSVPIDTRGLPIKVLSIANLLGKAIVRINSNESVTSLFRIKGI